MAFAEESYQPLLIRGLGLLINQAGASAEELEQAQHYLKALANPNMVLATRQVIAEPQRLNSVSNSVL